MIKFPEEGMWKKGIWLGSTVALLRNLALYKFPAKMSPAERVGSFKVISEALRAVPVVAAFQVEQAETLSRVDKEVLYEHFHYVGGVHEAGSGFLFDSTTLIALNFGNHLEVHTCDTTGNLTLAWGKIAQLCEEFAASHLCAFSPRFGYLTADPLRAGTTLEAKLFFHVPAVRHTEKLPQLLQSFKDEQLVCESLEGPLADLPGDILVVRNHYTLGVSEEALLNLLRTAALKIVAAEKAAREGLKAKPAPHIKDLVGKAFGILMHGYELHPKETMDALSALILGLNLGMVSQISEQKLFSLFQQAQRGHLAQREKMEGMNPEKLVLARAGLLHEGLKGVQVAD